MGSLDRLDAEEHPRRRVLLGGAGASVGIASLVLPAAAQAASPGSQSSPSAEPSVTATYNPATDTLTVVATRTDASAEGTAENSVVRRWPDGGSRTTSKYNSLTNSDPDFVWAAGSSTVTRALCRQMLGGPPSEGDAFSVLVDPPGSDSYVETASDILDRTTYATYSGLPTVHLTSLLEGLDAASGVRSDGSRSVEITPSSDVDIDLIVLRGGGTVADWTPTAFSVAVLDGSTEVGTLTHATDDGELAAVLLAAAPISLTSGTDYTFRIESSTADANLISLTTASGSASSLTQSRVVEVSGTYYPRWSIGLTSTG